MKKHFITECPLYKDERSEFYKKISFCNKNFNNLDDNFKFNWLFINENFDLLNLLGQFISIALEIRRLSNIETKQ